MTGAVESPAARLRRYFIEAKRTGSIGGAQVLQQLSDLASAAVNRTTDAQDAVAFALSDVFHQHATNRDERPVPISETYFLLASGEEHLSEAVRFIEEGGESDEAVRIIANLASLALDRLYGHWPPSGSGPLSLG